MPDTIEQAATGRAKCRGCGRTIAKGELRFGEALPNPYAEGEALFWFHLACAACMRPDKALAAIASSSEPIADRETLERLAQQGVAHPRLPRLAIAERSPSARARCRHCAELIDKGVFRLSLQLFEDGRATPIGSIHASCADGYFGTREILDRVRRTSPDLGATDLAEIARLLALPSPPAAEPPGDEAPGLVKTRAQDEAPPAEADGEAASGSATKRSAS